jgi:hypothetical protein
MDFDIGAARRVESLGNIAKAMEALESPCALWRMYEALLSVGIPNHQIEWKTYDAQGQTAHDVERGQTRKWMRSARVLDVLARRAAEVAERAKEREDWEQRPIVAEAAEV